MKANKRASKAARRFAVLHGAFEGLLLGCVDALIEDVAKLRLPKRRLRGRR